MVHRDVVLQHLETILNPGAFQDYCVNGLQVEGRTEVKRMAVGVSASMRLFEEAVTWGANLVIVHHGLFWKNTRHPFALTGVMKERVSFLLKHDLNLAAYHLPLDAHPEVGNNARIMAGLGAIDLAPVDVGYLGHFDPGLGPEEMRRRLDSILPTPARHFAYGPATIRRVAAISGGASGKIERAAGAGAEAFISGDLDEPVPRLAEELGIHYFAAGHYNSERLGPKALGDHLSAHFQLPVRFIETENPA